MDDIDITGQRCTGMRGCHLRLGKSITCDLSLFSIQARKAVGCSGVGRGGVECQGSLATARQVGSHIWARSGRGPGEVQARSQNYSNPITCRRLCFFHRVFCTFFLFVPILPQQSRLQMPTCLGLHHHAVM